MSLYSIVSAPTIFTNSIDGFATTLSGGVVTLTTLSVRSQYFTGASAHTVTLPVANTLAQGHEYYFRNFSSGLLTINTSGGNLLTTIVNGVTATVTCVNPAGGTGTASWVFLIIAAPSPVVMDSTATYSFPTAPAAEGTWYGDGTRAVCEETSVVFGNGATKLLGATDCVVIGRDANSRGSNSLVLGSSACALASTLTDSISFGVNTSRSCFNSVENTAIGNRVFSGIEFAASFSGTTMTVSSITRGILFIGMRVYTSGPSYNPATAVLQCTITGFGTGGGNNTGTYFTTIPVLTGGSFQCIGGVGTESSQNTQCGYLASEFDVGSRNTIIGNRCAFLSWNSNDNVYAGANITSGPTDRNVVIGNGTGGGSTITAGPPGIAQSGNTITAPIPYFIPDSVGSIISLDGIYSPITGYTSPTQVTSSISRTVVPPVSTGFLSAFSDSVVVGYFACRLVKSGRNVAIGSEALYGGGDNINTGNCTALGYQSLRGCGNGGTHTAIGHRSASGIGYGGSNVSIGSDSMLYVLNATSNVVIGTEAQQSSVIFTISGISASVMTVTSVQNGSIYIGMQVFAVFGSFQNNPGTSGSFTVLSFGTGTGGAGTYNVSMTLLGPGILYGSLDLPLNGVTAVGYRALQINGRSANTGIGHQALLQNTTGANNTGFGFNVGSTVTTGSGNTLLGAGADVNSGVRENSVALGSAITATQDGGFFVRHRGPAAFTVNSAGFIAATNEMVEVSSSIRTKENVVTLEDTSALFEKLRPVRYTPKLVGGLTQAEVRDCIGFIAEEVAELYPEVVTYSVGNLESSRESSEVSTEVSTEVYTEVSTDGTKVSTELIPSGMMYDRLVPILTEQLQSLMRECAKVRTVIESARSRRMINPV